MAFEPYFEEAVQRHKFMHNIRSHESAVPLSRSVYLKSLAHSSRVNGLK